MKIEITQAQKQVYKEEGLVAFDNLIPTNLLTHISDVDIGFNQFETDPQVLKLLTTKSIGDMLFQISSERPIRLLYCEVLEKGQLNFSQYPIQGHFAAVVIPCSENVTTVFASNTDLLIEDKCLVALYGISASLVIKSQEGKHLQKHLQNKGYNFGDRLHSNDSPLVYR